MAIAVVLLVVLAIGAGPGGLGARVVRAVAGSPAVDLDGLSVWGATARILSQLGAVLAR